VDIKEKINIDFHVLDTNDPKVFTVADYSTWGRIEKKNAIIEIITPGEEVPIVHYFNKRMINIFNSINLNINCPTYCTKELEFLDLHDGIYEITVKGSPDKYNRTRKYLRTEKIKLELDKLFIGLDLMCENKEQGLIDKITDIDMLLRAAESNTRYDNMCKAQELLFEAQELIKETKECSDCL